MILLYMKMLANIHKFHFDIKATKNTAKYLETYKINSHYQYLL